LAEKVTDKKIVLIYMFEYCPVSRADPISHFNAEPLKAGWSEVDFRKKAQGYSPSP
jgi:hypothetical protein